MVTPAILRAREVDPLGVSKLVAHEVQIALVFGFWGCLERGKKPGKNVEKYGCVLKERIPKTIDLLWFNQICWNLNDLGGSLILGNLYGEIQVQKN